jgi:hypothetical protein
MAATDLLREVSDTYNRRARLFPGFTITLPISILAVVMVTTKPVWWSAAVLLLGASGASYFGSQLVRSAGRRKEKQLWASWGGAPTTQLLRFRGASNRVEVQRRHSQLARLLPDLSIPDEATELANPTRADEHYEAAVRALIERTRDRAGFERVFDELCQYGFRRNLWGCRRLGLWLASLGLAATVALAILRVTDVFSASLLGLAISAVVSALLLLALALVVKPEWVREAAEAYAQRLMGSLETLLQNSDSGKRTEIPDKG